MNKLLIDVTLSFLEKSNYNRLEAEDVASLVKKAEQREYGGMFEAAIESIKEGQQEAWADGWKGGHEEGWKGGHEEVARKALAEGATFDFVQKITGLDMETIKRLTST